MERRGNCASLLVELTGSDVVGIQFDNGPPSGIGFAIGVGGYVYLCPGPAIESSSCVGFSRVYGCH